MEATKMAKQENIQVINEELTASVAASCLRTMTGDNDAEFERKVYYPYHRFSAHCSVPTMFGKESLSVTCLVDGINALGATADPFEVERIPVAADGVMVMKVVNDEAHRAAYRILMHQMSRRLKMIASFDICLAKRGIVYKAFWILRSRDVLFMVDSVTGGMHPLRSIAA
jgi:hypothetical protein